jgi:beta-glucosidase
MLMHTIRRAICYAILLFPATIVRGQTPASPTEDYDAQATQIVAQMTLDEKIAQLHGIKDKTDYRVVPGLARLGIPALTICNGPAGVGPAGPGHAGQATALPAPISLAATWDLDAARAYGQTAGSDSAALGNSLLESPDINIARTPKGGRTFEGFGEDPFLVGQISVAEIQGIQSQHVIANVKHYAANNQEWYRTRVNEIIDERTLREIYLPAFEASVKEGHVASVMAAYNHVNGEFCCENTFLLNQVLKGDWAFDGFVSSDFGAVHSTIPSAENGLDLELPTGQYFGRYLKAAVESGKVPESLLDEKLIRRFRAMMRLGVWKTPPASHVIPPEHAAAAMKLGTDGIVLLKNTGGQLPLDAGSIHSIVLIGPFAGHAITGGGGSSHVIPILTIRPIDGIQSIVGKSVAIQEDDGTSIPHAAALAKAADVAILMLGDRQSEGHDHDLALSGNQDQLAAAVLAANPRTIVVLKTGGPVLMPWIDQAHAILEAWYPGEEDGAVVAAVLFGAVNPSGKLPITFPKRDADIPLQTPEQYPGVNLVAHYSEGLFVGYRWYDAKNIEPLFPFGFGLSYTTFAYKDLQISPSTDSTSATVQFTLTNTGPRAGAEVAQVYVTFPPGAGVSEPPRQLKGFRRVDLAAGQSATVSIPLDARAFSYWDSATHAWKTASGAFTISVAASSREIRLSDQLDIK